MTVRDPQPPQSRPGNGHLRRRHRTWCPRPLRPILAGLLGVAVALVLVSCGSSGKGLIPAANAGPLKSDFEAVAQAAQTGEGNCAATEAALATTEQDFAALPTTIAPGLHSTLSKGIANLRRRALALCAQPLPQTTVTSTTPTTTTSTESTPTPAPTHTTTTETTATTPTTAVPPGPGGGTQAPGESEEGELPQEPGKGHGKGDGKGNPGGAGAGGAVVAPSGESGK